jgi:hypothetical protein
MYEIKADPKLPYHYIIGVAIKTPFSKNYGQLFLKYFLEFQHEDIEKVRTAIRLSEDRMFPSGITKKEAIQIAGCGQIVWEITALKMSASSNDATVHHFSSPVKVDDKFFEDLVQRANTDKHDKKLLDKSRI